RLRLNTHAVQFVFSFQSFDMTLPVGEVQHQAASRYVLLPLVADHGQMAVPGPACLLRVAIRTGSLQNRYYVCRRLRQSLKSRILFYRAVTRIRYGAMLRSDKTYTRHQGSGAYRQYYESH